MSPDTLLTQAVALAGHLAWPLIVLASLLVFGREVKSLLKELASRVQRSRSIRLRVPGGELALLHDRIERQEDRTEVLREALPIVQVHRAEPSTDLISHLIALANDHQHTTDPDWRTRVQKKNGLVRKMVATAVAGRVPREFFLQADNEGLRAGLAGLIEFDPSEGDLRHLVAIAERATSRHVRYRAVLALIRLLGAGKVSGTDLGTARQLLRHANVDPDKSLSDIIRRAERALNRVADEGGMPNT